MRSGYSVLNFALMGMIEMVELVEFVLQQMGSGLENCISNDRYTSNEQLAMIKQGHATRPNLSKIDTIFVCDVHFRDAICQFLREKTLII